MGFSGDTGAQETEEIEEEGINAPNNKTGPIENVQRLRFDDETQAVQRNAGIDEHVRPKEVLRSEVHGERTRERDLLQHVTQPIKVNAVHEGELRDVRINGVPPCSSQGREPAQQRSIQFADFVRELPRAGAFAELRQDHRTAQILSALLKGVGAGWSVQYASQPTEAIWGSMPEEVQDRVRMAFNAGGWRMIPSGFPLAEKAEARVARLRGYGDGIVAPQAAAFVRSYMDL